MSDGSAIEWTEATWQPITGCSVVSPGCTNCYAMRLAGTRLRHHPSREGLTRASKAGPVWTGEVRFNEQWLTQPLQWKRPRMIFVCAHGDLFHEDVPDEWIDRVFAIMTLAPLHTFQVLTKRADRMRRYFADPSRRGAIAIQMGMLCATRGLNAMTFGRVQASRLSSGEGWPLPNVWLGVSAERQQEADARIPHLLATPAAVRWVSAEPLLGPIDLEQITLRKDGELPNTMSNLLGDFVQPLFGNFTDSPRLNWIVAGGESGPGARPMHPDWPRSLRKQCDDAGVPFFFKQWGNWTPGENVECQRGTVATATWFDERWLFERESLANSEGHIDDEPDLYEIGKKAAGRLLDGREHNDMPEVAA